MYVNNSDETFLVWYRSHISYGDEKEFKRTNYLKIDQN